MDPFSPGTLGERLMSIVRFVICITVVQFLLVWMIGFLTLAWAQANDNQVMAKVVRYATTDDGYYGVFDISGLQEYVTIRLSNKQFDGLNTTKNDLWALSRDIEPMWLDSGHPFPMFSNDVVYPDWYRLLRPGVDYCKPALYYLTLQLTFALSFMFTFGGSTRRKTKSFYEQHREITQSFKQSKKKPEPPPGRNVSELWGEIPSPPKRPIPPDCQVSNDSVFGGHE